MIARPVSLAGGGATAIIVEAARRNVKQLARSSWASSLAIADEDSASSVALGEHRGQSRPIIGRQVRHRVGERFKSVGVAPHRLPPIVYRSCPDASAGKAPVTSGRRRLQGLFLLHR